MFTPGGYQAPREGENAVTPKKIRAAPASRTIFDLTNDQNLTVSDVFKHYLVCIIVISVRFDVLGVMGGRGGSRGAFSA